MNPPQHINNLVREEVRATRAYQTPPADGLIKLDAMENPYSLPAELRDAWLTRLGAVAVNRYPDPQCKNLKAAIRDTFNIADEHGLVLGNGSDELIQMLALLVGGRGRTILAPTPTFAMYELIAKVTGAEFIGVPLRDDFALDGDALLESIAKHKPACVFLAFPNNPTGNCFDEEVITEVLNRAPGIVVLDEAYFAFCRRSFLSRLAEFPDAFVLRTLSKSGMAGLRLGMLIAHPDWTTQLEKIRLPYNIGSLTQAGAAFYLAHHDTMQNQATKIIKQREVVMKKLKAEPKVQPYPSEANFILFQTPNAEKIYNQLQNAGVLIKNLNPTIKDHLRVTIGTESENKKFLTALRKSLQ